MKVRLTCNVEGILLAPQRLGRHYPAGQLLAEILPISVVRGCWSQRTHPQLLLAITLLSTSVVLVGDPVARR